MQTGWKYNKYNEQNYYTPLSSVSYYMVRIFFLVKGKGKREYIILVMIRTAIIEYILSRNSLPERKIKFKKTYAHRNSD